MAVMRWLLPMGLMMLAGCQAVAVAAGRPTGDTKTWKTYRVDVGEHVVQFSIPPGESREFPNYTIPARIDLAGEGMFDEALDGPALLNRVWDYRSSRFVQVDGSLSASISVSRSEQPLDDLEALRRAVEESSRLYAMKMYVEEGRSRPSDIPERFDLVRIGNQDGWRVRYELSGPSYAVRLDQHHYLVVTLDYAGFTKQDWQTDAKAAADSILRSIRIDSR